MKDEQIADPRTVFLKTCQQNSPEIMVVSSSPRIEVPYMEDLYSRIPLSKFTKNTEQSSGGQITLRWLVP
jgi:hypothetical protein